MTLFDALDLCLAVIVLGVAAWTMAAREMFSAVVGYVAYGLLLAIVWVRLYAPDVALTEAPIGGGVTGVLLVTAAARLRRLPTPDAPAGRSLKIAAGLLSVVVAGALAAAVLYLPDPAPSLAPEADKELAATGLGNAVTAVLIAYRSFDTMLEKVVLVLAVIGVWSVAPDRFWGGAPAPLGSAAPDAALVFLARVLAPIGMEIGVEIFWVGADEPGGGVPGRRDLGRNVDAGDDGEAERATANRGALASPRADRRARDLPLSSASLPPLMAGSFFAIPSASPSRSSCSSRPSWC